MRILITGATGFLGRALCGALAEAGHDLVPLGSRQADLTRPDALQPWSRQRFDQIYHLAAWTQAGDFCLRHPGEQWLRNQAINTHMLQWWHAHQPQAKLIAMGTSCAYPPELPHVEENYLQGRPTESLLAYAMTKRMLYVGLLALTQQYGLKYLCLVPSTLYGPAYHTDGRQMHFIFDLIRKILRGKLYDEEVVLWGDGEQRREVVWLDDFVRITLRLASSVDNELINIGAGEEHTIREFAAMICEQVGYPLDRVRFDMQRYVGARSKCLQIGKLNRLVGPMERMPLAKGLALTIDWFLRQREVLLPAPAIGACVA
jgi:GDP-L-fucose synthase